MKIFDAYFSSSFFPVIWEVPIVRQWQDGRRRGGKSDKKKRGKRRN